MVSDKRLRTEIARLQRAVTQSFLAHSRDVQLPVTLTNSSVSSGRRGVTMIWDLRATVEGKVESAVLRLTVKPGKNCLPVDINLNCSDGYLRAEIGRRLSCVPGLLGFVPSWDSSRGASTVTASALIRL